MSPWGKPDYERNNFDEVDEEERENAVLII